MTTHAIVVSAAVWIRTRCLLLRFAGLVFGCTSLLHAQTASTSMSGVPRLLILSGTAVDPHGKGIPGVTGVACAICKDQSGGAPLRMEDADSTCRCQGPLQYATGLERKRWSAG
jgi:hypothetical protein